MLWYIHGVLAKASHTTEFKRYRKMKMEIPNEIMSLQDDSLLDITMHYL
jgi:hypothetical protein